MPYRRYYMPKGFGVAFEAPMTPAQPAPVDHERIDALIAEYSDYSPRTELGRVYGTCSIGEFQSVLATIRHLRAENEALTKLVYVPGLWRCAKCKCTVVSTNLHYPSGGFSANNKPQECPNNCGPMWRVTERDAGNQACDRAEAAEATAARLRGALEKFGDHDKDCGVYEWLDEPACTCGLSAALEGAKSHDVP
jgi:hypothetical protein